MNRREALRAVGVAAALPALGLSVTSATRSDLASYAPLGRVPLDGAAEAVVGDDGATVFVAALDGFTTVDASDPNDPTVLAEQFGLLEDEDAGPLTQIFDVTVDDGQLIAAGPANPGGGAFEGFVRYDVSDPADPVRIGDPYETGFAIHNCFLRDDVLYLVSTDGESNPLVMIDVSGDVPEEVGRWSLLDHDPAWESVHYRLWNLHDVTVRDGVACLSYWEAGTYLVDVSDPTDPRYVTHVPAGDVDELRDYSSSDARAALQGPPGNHHYATLDESGSVLVVGKESWSTESDDPDGASGVELWDVSTPDAPERLSTIEPPETYDASYGGLWTTSHNFELRGDTLLTSWYQGGVKVHDASDPTALEELAWWRRPLQAAFWTARALDPAESFVASSAPVAEPAVEPALYTFPIAEGRQQDPPSLTDAPPERETENGTPTETPTATDAPPADASDDVPGFTAFAGVAGGALALETLRRRRGRDR